MAGDVRQRDGRGARAAGLAVGVAVCLGLGAWARGGEGEAVRLDVGKDALRLGNGLVEMRVGLDGRLRGLSRTGGAELLGDAGGYWHANSNAMAGEQTPRQQFVTLGGPHVVIRNTGECVEVAFVQQPAEHFPFRGELHYVLRRRQSGFYVFMSAEHDANMPAGFLEQYAYNLRLSGERFG